MSCKFSFFISFTDSLKENDVGVFKSDNGDLYTVKYKSNVCRDLMLTVEWRIPKQILLTVKLYNTTFKRCFSSRGIIVSGRKTFMKLRGAFNVSGSPNYKVLCVINLIPYIKFNADNEIASQSFDSGFTETDFQLSSIEENDDSYNNRNFTGENNKECSYVRNIIHKEKNEIVLSDLESPESNMESDHDLQSEGKDIEDHKLSCKDGMSMEESSMIISENILEVNETELPVTSLSKSNFIICDQNDKTKNGKACEELNSKEYLKSGEILHTDESTLMNNPITNKENTLIKESDMKINDFDSSMKIDERTENKKQDVLLNDKLNEDFSQKVITEENTHVNDNQKLMDVKIKNSERMDEESNLAMKNELLESTSKNLSVSQEEECVSDKKAPKTNKMLSCIKLPYLKKKIKPNIPKRIDNKNRLCISNKSKGMMESSNFEHDISLKSYVPKKYNQILENDLSSSSCSNIATLAVDQNSLNIKKEKHLSNVKSESPSTSFQKTPDEIKASEIKSRTTDCSEPVAQELSPSKTRFVFKELVRKLSTDECDLELSMNKKAESISGVNIKSPPESKLAKAKILPAMESQLKGLAMDMLDLLTTGDMVDAIIVNGEKSIKVHRAIISARSSVLKQMFTEQRKKDIKYSAIVDIPSDIFEDVIVFLYVGLVYIKNTKMAQDLHAVAETYRINDLIDICTKYMSE